MVVVQLFGGPGISKSTTALGLSNKLKKANKIVEYVPEFAKKLVWSERFNELKLQPYVTINQWKEVEILRGKVEVVVTDSPMILGIVYQETPDSIFEDYLLHLYNQFNSVNILLERDPDYHPYQEQGRTQSLEESIKKDQQVKDMLDRKGINYTTIKASPSTEDEVLELIFKKLEEENGN